MDSSEKYSSKAAIHYRKYVMRDRIPAFVESNDFVLVDDDADKLLKGEDEQDNLQLSINL